MTTLLKAHHVRTICGAWLVLMGLTAASWWVGADHGLAGMGRDLAMVSILLLTFAKIYVVGHSFMELREAARWLVGLFSTWCVALCSVLVGLYFALV